MKEVDVHQLEFNGVKSGVIMCQIDLDINQHSETAKFSHNSMILLSIYMITVKINVINRSY